MKIRKNEIQTFKYFLTPLVFTVVSFYIPPCLFVNLFTACFCASVYNLFSCHHFSFLYLTLYFSILSILSSCYRLTTLKNIFFYFPLVLPSYVYFSPSFWGCLPSFVRIYIPYPTQKTFHNSLSLFWKQMHFIEGGGRSENNIIVFTLMLKHFMRSRKFSNSFQRQVKFL